MQPDFDIMNQLSHENWDSLVILIWVSWFLKFGAMSDVVPFLNLHEFYPCCFHSVSAVNWYSLSVYQTRHRLYYFSHPHCIASILLVLFPFFPFSTLTNTWSCISCALRQPFSWNNPSFSALYILPNSHHLKNITRNWVYPKRHSGSPTDIVKHYIVKWCIMKYILVTFTEKNLELMPKDQW